METHTSVTWEKAVSSVFVVASIFATLAALLHVYIFVLESVLWTTPRARKTFGMTEQQADDTRELAYNQGFYNLFLAVIAIIGVVALLSGTVGVGSALIFAGCGSMVAAGLVLLLSSRSKARAALTQLAFPLIAVILLLIGLLV